MKTLKKSLVLVLALHDGCKRVSLLAQAQLYTDEEAM